MLENKLAFHGQYISGNLAAMAILVVEFSGEGYKIRKDFA